MANKIAKRLTDLTAIGAFASQLNPFYFGGTYAHNCIGGSISDPPEFGGRVWTANVLFVTAQSINSTGFTTITTRARQAATFRHMGAPWQLRSWMRFQLGEYRPIPLANLNITFNLNLVLQHIPHIDPADPTRIRFFASEEHAKADRHTSVTLGRYLMTYYRDDFSESEIRDIAAHFTAGTRRNGFTILTTPDDIADAYRAGPRSCMSYENERYDLRRQHPTLVYGNSDIALAVLKDGNRITARALIWPAQMKYSRLYGDTTALREALRHAGYSHGSLAGARIARITHERCNDHILLPYIDRYYQGCDDGAGGAMWVAVHDDHLILHDRNQHTGVFCCEASSTAGSRELPERHVCENCNTSFFGPAAATLDGGVVCPDCIEHYVYLARRDVSARIDDERVIYDIARGEYDERRASHQTASPWTRARVPGGGCVSSVETITALAPDGSQVIIPRSMTHQYQGHPNFNPGLWYSPASIMPGNTLSPLVCIVDNTDQVLPAYFRARLLEQGYRETSMYRFQSPQQNQQSQDAA